MTALRFRVVFLFALGVGFGLFIPGILCPSCCENTAGGNAKDRAKTTAKNKCLYDETGLFIIPSTWVLVRAIRETTCKAPAPVTAELLLRFVLFHFHVHVARIATAAAATILLGMLGVFLFRVLHSLMLHRT